MSLPPPYSTRFVDALNSTSPAAVSYTVPPNKTAIISCMTATKAAAATPVDVTFSVLPTGSGSLTTIWFSSMISTAKIQTDLWNGHVVLNAGDQVTAQRSTAAGTWGATISGYLLTN